MYITNELLFTISLNAIFTVLRNIPVCKRLKNVRDELRLHSLANAVEMKRKMKEKRNQKRKTDHKNGHEHICCTVRIAIAHHHHQWHSILALSHMIDLFIEFFSLS